MSGYVHAGTGALRHLLIVHGSEPTAECRATSEWWCGESAGHVPMCLCSLATRLETHGLGLEALTYCCLAVFALGLVDKAASQVYLAI